MPAYTGVMPISVPYIMYNGLLVIRDFMIWKKWSFLILMLLLVFIAYKSPEMEWQITDKGNHFVYMSHTHVESIKVDRPSCPKCPRPPLPRKIKTATITNHPKQIAWTLRIDRSFKVVSSHRSTIMNCITSIVHSCFSRQQQPLQKVRVMHFDESVDT